MKVLLLSKKNVCYDSYLYFSDMVGRELTSCGCDVEEFTYEEGRYDDLESLCGSSYDVILDFNSMLPRMILDDDSRLLSHIEGAFFDFILDHPLYHHDSLSVPLRDFHVICLDRNHKAYIEEMYPHIASVDIIGTTGSVAEDFDENGIRDIDILFTGTYTSPDDVMASIGHTPPFIRHYIHSLIDMMEEDKSLPLEKAVDRLIDTEDNEVLAETKAFHIQSFFLADTYMRAKVREDVIKAIIRARLPITLYGDGWEKMRGYEAAPARQVDFAGTFSLMARSKITLNVMPCFKAGVHDRVYSAMMNGSLSLTDPSVMLAEQFEDGKDIAFYSISDLEALPGMIEHFLKNPEEMKAVALAGRKKALFEHSWEKRVKAIAKITGICPEP